ncbi:glutathione S-transferase [Vibrio pelagius]|uniref:Glutathione S-transferase n=1 Tax=Vibrio pelagius TaxID=28169 RepID=A0ABY5G4A3_VIBPE|nr:glutathione S-transferase [Vibrio pelagius]UTT84856.1 glutathione S-transferase [Vibrio pelagius]
MTTKTPLDLPILYSLRRCPYAMRARLGILLANQQVLIREIVTKDKPQELLNFSPKGTVPVLVLSDGKVIEQSLQVMVWALELNDPQDLLRQSDDEAHRNVFELIEENDNIFIRHLEQYRAAVRYHNEDLVDRRTLCEEFLTKLETRLKQGNGYPNKSYLFGDTPSVADYAIVPFISQFARVEKKWFNQSRYIGVQAWLRNILDSTLYSKTMKAYPLWNESKQDMVFGDSV